MATFEFDLDNSVNITRTPVVKVIKFGDGYEQRQRQGMTPILSEYSVSKIALPAVITAIDDFLKARAGVESFLWTPEGEEQGKFVCEQWQITKILPMFTLTATFREVLA